MVRPLTSWVSDDMPSSGSFTLRVDRNSTNQLITWWHENIYWTSGMGFENFRFIDISFHHYQFISNEHEKYFKISGEGEPFVRLTPDGKIVGAMFEYATCELYSKDHRSGCTNYSLPKCKVVGNMFSDGGGIGRYGLFETIGEDYNSLSITDCKARCMQNCSCYGYASLYENGTGCQFMGEGIGNSLATGLGLRHIYIRGTNTTKG